MKIKKLREQYGVTQVELAYATGIGRFKLFLFEKGYQEPSKQEVEKIITHLRLSAHKKADKDATQKN